MRNLLILSAITLLTIVIACAKPGGEATANSANTETPAVGQKEEAPRISLEDAKKAFDDGTAIFIDARASEAYKLEHIKGAINITADTLSEKLKDLPKDKTLIAYCS